MPKSRSSPARVLVAMDSFKETMSAREACAAVAEGLRQEWPNTAIIRIPLADGGAGTAEALRTALGGECLECQVTGPHGGQIAASWVILPDGRAAIDMAAASGLALVPASRRNPMRATSRGTGELILEAIRRGCRSVLLGIGDTATVDGGLGACQALGARFRDQAGAPIDEPLCGEILSRIQSVDLERLRLQLDGTEIQVLCDVDNPLLGPNGAAAVFGPQKGALPEDIPLLEEGLRSAFTVIERATDTRVFDLRGAGAAGGMGAGSAALLGARLVPGGRTVLQVQGFAQALHECDLVVTGEGSLDAQSLRGKGPGLVARAAREGVKPVWALVGVDRDGGETARALFIERVETLRRLDEPIPRPDQSVEILKNLARRMARGWSGQEASSSKTSKQR